MSILTGGGLITALGFAVTALIQTIRMARAQVKAVELETRLSLAQVTIKQKQDELTIAQFQRANDNARSAERIAYFKERNNELEAILAKHPEFAGDLFRDRGRRVLPDKGSNGSGASGPVSG